MACFPLEVAALTVLLLIAKLETTTMADEVRKCRLSGLRDLAGGDEYVRVRDKIMRYNEYP